MLKEINAINYDTGEKEGFELHGINYHKKNGKIKSVDLFRNGKLETYVKTGNAVFYSNSKSITIPAYELEGR